MLGLQVQLKVKRGMKIGDVAKLLGLSSSAIRFYEQQGLLNSNGIRRAPNGYRVYCQADIDDIRRVMQFKAFGMELDDIKSLLGKNASVCGDLVSRLDDQLATCREMERAIQARITALETSRDSCVSRCPPTRPVRQCCVEAVT